MTLCGGPPDAIRSRAQQRLESVLWRVEHGQSVAGICADLDFTPGALYRFLHRQARADVARKLGLARRMYDYTRAEKAQGDETSAA